MSSKASDEIKAIADRLAKRKDWRNGERWNELSAQLTALYLEAKAIEADEAPGEGQ